MMKVCHKITEEGLSEGMWGPVVRRRPGLGLLGAAVLAGTCSLTGLGNQDPAGSKSAATCTNACD